MPEHKETLSLKGYIPIFKSKSLILLILNITFTFAPYCIFLGMSSILYIGDLGVSLAHYGYYQGAWALVFAVGSVVIGSILNRFSKKKILTIGLYICSFGLVIISLVSFLNCSNPLFITLAFLPFSIGSIIPITILYPLIFNLIPSVKSRASAVTDGGRLILIAIGVQSAGYYYQGSVRNIAIVIICFVSVSIITLLYVIKNCEIMDFLEKE